MEVKRVLLASPRSFCAGVEMAIKALAWMVQLCEPPIYCYHEIVHNKAIVERFRSAGVVFVGDIGQVPFGAPLMLSAHGAAPDVVAAARARGGVVVDAVCPLVAKVHHEIKQRAAKGYSVVYVGHRDHDEALAAMAVAPDVMHLVASQDDVASLLVPDGPVALVTQTTLSEAEWAEPRGAAEKRFPDLWTAGRADICFATTNRQSAVAKMAETADALVIVGSSNSSNTMALAKVARARGCPRVYRVDGADELPDDLAGIVGVTAGASTPDSLVHQVIELLAPALGVENVVVTDEDEYFPLPRELRELLVGGDAFVGARRDAMPPPGWTSRDDRRRPAAEMLDELAGLPHPDNTGAVIGAGKA
jgi:4-hydroxy-3-methylbut-2-en-1-yl diphosphate reductase